MAAPYKYARNYDAIPRPKSGIQCFYQMLIAGGILVTEHNNELTIQAPHNNVSPVLQKEIDKRKAALIQHLRSLPK